MLVLPCQHNFHAGCVRQWLVQEGAAAYCPLCKAPVFQQAQQAAAAGAAAAGMGAPAAATA